MLLWEILAIVGSGATIGTVLVAHVRRFVSAKMDKEIKPMLVNDNQTVAKYAHEARDAAIEAKEAAIGAKEAALQAKEAVSRLERKMP